MTTKPKARRFRLRLGEDATGARLPAVSAPGATTRPSHPVRAEVQRTARPGLPAEAAPATPAAPPGEAGAAPTPQAPASTLTRTAAAAMAMAKLRQGAAAARRPVPGEESAPPPPAAGGEHNADTVASSEVEAEIEAIRAEELTGRQLRMAMRVAQKHGIKATSGLE